MAILPTASKIDLAMLCVLPWHGSMMPWPKQKYGLAAARGTDVHATAEAHANGERPSHDYTKAQNVHDTARVAVDELTDGALYVTERPVAYDPITGVARLLEKPDSPRDYSQVRQGELVGTIDLLIVRPGEVIIADHKTGRKAKTGKASDSWQLRLIAVAVAKLFGLDTVKVMLVHLDEADYEPDTFEFAPWDLDEFATALRDMVERINQGTIVGNIGVHCYDRFCPVRLKCPTIAAALEVVGEEAKRRLPVLNDIENNEQAVALRVAIKQGEELLKQAQSKLEEYASKTPVYMGDGVVFAHVECRGHERIDLTVSGALEKVREIVGDDAIKKTVSKESIELAARAKQAKRGQGKKHADKCFDDLRAMGAMARPSSYMAFKDIRPKSIDTTGVEVANDDGALLASGE